VSETEGGQSGRCGRLSPPRQGAAGAAGLGSVDPAGAAGAVVVEAATGVDGLFDAGGLSVELEVPLHCQLREAGCCCCCCSSESTLSRTSWAEFAAR
jgi:hypothetical protein